MRIRAVALQFGATLVGATLLLSVLGSTAYGAVNLVQNPGFESHSALATTPPQSHMLDAGDVDFWYTSAPDNLIELWETGFEPAGVGTGIYLAHSGTWFAEVNANFASTLYQAVPASPGSLYCWGVWHMGRLGVDSMQVLVDDAAMYPFISGVMQASPSLADPANIWGYHSGYFTLDPAHGFTTMQLQLQALTTSGGHLSMGNLIDDVELYKIADPTEQTIRFGDPKPPASTLAALCFDGYSCAYHDTSFDGSVGTHDVTVDIKNPQGRVIGTVVSRIIVEPCVPKLYTVAYRPGATATVYNLPLGGSYFASDTVTVQSASQCVGYRLLGYRFEVANPADAGLFAPTTYQPGATLTMPATNLVATALWQKTWTVSFDTQGGTPIPVQVIDADTTPRIPSSPTRPGFTFAGWFTADGKPYDFTRPVTGAVALYARWKVDPTASAVLNTTATSGIPQTSDVLDAVLLARAVLTVGASLIGCAVTSRIRTKRDL